MRFRFRLSFHRRRALAEGYEAEYEAAGTRSRSLRPKGRRIVSLGFAVWFCLAVAIGLAGGLRNAQPPMLPALIGTLGAALFVSWRVPLIIVTHILLFVRQAPALRDC